MNRSSSNARSRKSRRLPTLEPHPTRHRAIMFHTRRQTAGILPTCRPPGKTQPRDPAAKHAKTPSQPPYHSTHHRSKPGGHPGHDKSRRLSLPPVVAPEIFETMDLQAVNHSPQETLNRDHPVSELCAPDRGSFCRARARCQGRFIAHGVHAKRTAQSRENSVSL